MQKATKVKRMEAPNQALWSGMKGSKDFFPRVKVELIEKMQMILTVQASLLTD